MKSLLLGFTLFLLLWAQSARAAQPKPISATEIKGLRKSLGLTPCWTLQALKLKGVARYLVAIKHASADAPREDIRCGARSAPIRLALVERGRRKAKRNLWIRCEQMEIDGEECSQIRLRLSLLDGGEEWVRLAVGFEASLVGEDRSVEKTFIYQLAAGKFQQRYRGRGDENSRFDLCRISFDSDCPKAALMGDCVTRKTVTYRLGKRRRHVVRETRESTAFVPRAHDLTQLPLPYRKSIRPAAEVRRRCKEKKETFVAHKLPLARINRK